MIVVKSLVAEQGQNIQSRIFHEKKTKMIVIIFKSESITIL